MTMRRIFGQATLEEHMADQTEMAEEWRQAQLEASRRRLKLARAFEDADAAWQAELTRRFGKDAGNARYDPRGRGSFDDDLGRLFLARDKARMLWEAARPF